MAPTIFAEKDFSRILSDVNGYSYVFLDRIREWNWFTLVYDNSEYEAYYCPDLLSFSILVLTKPPSVSYTHLTLPTIYSV